MNTYLQLSTENQGKVDEYAEELLQAQQSHDKVVPLFAVEVLSDVSLSAGLGESLFEEYETETVYAEEEQYGYDIAAWIKGDSMEPIYLDGEVALSVLVVLITMVQSTPYLGMILSILKNFIEKKMALEWCHSTITT